MFDKIDRNKLLLYVNDRDKLTKDVNVKYSIIKQVVPFTILITVFMAIFVWFMHGGTSNSNMLLGYFIIYSSIALVPTLPIFTIVLISRKREIKKLFMDGEIKILKIDNGELGSKTFGITMADSHKFYGEVYNIQTSNMEKRTRIKTVTIGKYKQMVSNRKVLIKELSIDEDLIRPNNHIVVLEYKNKFYFLPNKLWEKPFSDTLNKV